MSGQREATEALRARVAWARKMAAAEWSDTASTLGLLAAAVERVLDLCDRIDVELEPWTRDDPSPTVTARIRAALLGES